MSAIVIRDGIVHYEVIGRGRPVVFLHGALGTWNMWMHSMQTISTDFRSIAFDFWGFGTTAQRTDRYNLDNQTQLLDEFLNEFGMTKVVIIAHGVGALIALKYADKMPFAVDRMLLSSFPTIKKGFDPAFYDWTNREKDIWLRRNKNYKPLVKNFRQSDINAVNTFFDEGSNFATDEYLKKTKIPTLLVHGENDEMTIHNYQALDRSFHSNTHHIKLEHAGFFPMMDNRNQFNRLIVDFLALKSGESPRNLQLKEEWVRRVR